MTAALRRGACPTLAAPMRTGDGWLARLTLADGLTGAQLAGLAAAAARLGNGVIEVTSRGSLQLRGLAEDGAGPLAEAVAALGVDVAPGLPVVTSPLAGQDPAEAADPRPLAAALRGFAGALPPKASAVVDGGGGFPLDEVAADLRLRAGDGGWRVGVGGTAAEARWLGISDEAGAVATAVRLLGRMAREGRRGRELDGVGPACPPPRVRPAVSAVGWFTVRTGFARGVGLAFGQAGSDAVAGLAAAAGDARLHPAPGRALVAVGLAADADTAFVAAAARLGFVTDPGDPRLGVVACAGAPACASGRLATRRIAARIAAERPGGEALVHVSGCAKRCAQPSGPAVTLVAEAGGCRVTGDGRAVPPALQAFLLEAAAW